MTITTRGDFGDNFLYKVKGRVACGAPAALWRQAGPAAALRPVRASTARAHRHFNGAGPAVLPSSGIAIVCSDSFGFLLHRFCFDRAAQLRSYSAKNDQGVSEVGVVLIGGDSGEFTEECHDL
ncbi:hypothetical protein, partial [Nonomuraea jabiensis]|uniref:hypothetical protein n=1 Tax=Nonomuraea jabiensis TaxID=882448 RepID=UPI003D76091C